VVLALQAQKDRSADDGDEVKRKQHEVLDNVSDSDVMPWKVGLLSHFLPDSAALAAVGDDMGRTCFDQGLGFGGSARAREHSRISALTAWNTSIRLCRLNELLKIIPLITALSFRMRKKQFTSASGPLKMPNERTWGT
jgi:hypothetical protein